MGRSALSSPSVPVDFPVDNLFGAPSAGERDGGSCRHISDGERLPSIPPADIPNL